MKKFQSHVLIAASLLAAPASATTLLPGGVAVSPSATVTWNVSSNRGAAYQGADDGLQPDGSIHARTPSATATSLRSDYKGTARYGALQPALDFDLLAAVGEPYSGTVQAFVRTDITDYIVPENGLFSFEVKKSTLALGGEIPEGVAQIRVNLELVTAAGSSTLLAQTLRLSHDGRRTSQIEVARESDYGVAGVPVEPMDYEEVPIEVDGLTITPGNPEFARALSIPTQTISAHLTGGQLTVQPGDKIDLFYEAQVIAIGNTASFSVSTFGDPFAAGAPTAPVPVPAPLALLVAAVGAIRLAARGG